MRGSGKTPLLTRAPRTVVGTENGIPALRFVVWSGDSRAGFLQHGRGLKLPVLGQRLALARLRAGGNPRVHQKASQSQKENGNRPTRHGFSLGIQFHFTTLFSSSVPRITSDVSPPPASTCAV